MAKENITKQQQEYRELWAETFRIACMGDAICGRKLHDNMGRGCIIGIMLDPEEIKREKKFHVDGVFAVISQLSGISENEIIKMVSDFDSELLNKEEAQKWLDSKAYS